jgi:hypothetical protein
MQMHEDQMALARDQMGMAQGHYDYGLGVYEQNQQRFDPILDAMQAEALSNQTPDYGLISSDAAQAFESQRQAGQRQMERYGINPGDGMWGANNRQAQLGQASAEVMARAQARRDTNNQRYAQLANLYGVGTTLMGQGMGMMGQGLAGSSAAAGMGINSAGQAASAYGNQAAQSGQQASNNWASFGQHLASGIDSLTTPTPQSPATPDYGPAPAGSSGTAPWRP